jgi:hypothetical protein
LSDKEVLMRKFAFAFAAVVAIMGLTGAGSAAAQNLQSYVSGNGVDPNTCGFKDPCFSLNTAINNTAPGGEVHCLDSGIGFGSVAINQSVTIDCAGVPGFLTINGSGIVVTLRNLTIASAGRNNLTGIDFQQGAALFVENCVVEGWAGNAVSGIHFAPASGTAKLYVTDSVIKNNGDASGGGGIYIQPGSGAAINVTITRTQIENNRLGIFATGGAAIHGAVRDSVVSGSATWGIGVAGTKANLSVENTTVSGNNNGLVAESGGSMLVSHSSIVQNGTGLLKATGGAIASYKNNNLIRNTTDGTFSSTLVQQ